MAIWPFGRKGKRPRSQMKASDAADRRLSFEDAADKSAAAERALVTRKPSRKRSKREKHRSAPSLRHQSSPRAAAGEPVDPTSTFAYNLDDNHTSLSSIGQDNFTVARATPTLQKRESAGKGNTLKKRLSKRSARELQREREIKALSSSPPSGNPRFANTWGYHASDVRRGPSVHSRHGDYRTSNQSLPMGSQSSLSDTSDLQTYKVNAFAVLTPRPVIRYSENHNKHLPPRSTNPSSNSMRKEINLGDEDDWKSQKRVAELADDLDASALRELLERDRRRREKKRLEDQERRQRRIQRRLEREQHESEHAANKVEKIDIDDLRGRDKTPSPATSSRRIRPESTIDEAHTQQTEESIFSPEPGSWLREPSNNSQQRENRYSDISAHVIGNIDDRSIRAGKQGHDVNVMSEEDVSRHRSPLFQAVANTSSARMSSIAQESISDLSRTENSEKRLSDTSSRRMSSWIAFFRRNSLRKRRSREIDAPPSEFSNTSRDSFMKAQQGAGPSMPIPIPERNFRRAGTFRSQSKFVEHIDNYPISPPDSRMQSPLPVPLETVHDMPVDDLNSVEPSPRQSFTEGDDYNYGNGEPSRPMSWDEKSGVLSQSLASIDSEGSWMSGSYLRRISQKNPNFTSWRNSGGMNKLDKYDETEENEDDVANDEYLNRLAEESPEQMSNSVAGMRRPSSTAIGLDIAEAESEDSRLSSNDGGMETWHQGLERKPTVVRRESGRVRAMSNEVIFGDVAMLDTASMDGETSPISPVSQEAEINRATSVDYGREHKHARSISAGSAKLLDIPPRASVDSRE